MPKHNLLKNKDLTIIIYNICRLISQCLKFVGKYNTQKKITLYYQGVKGENLIKKDSRLRFDRNLLFFYIYFTGIAYIVSSITGFISTLSSIIVWLPIFDSEVLTSIRNGIVSSPAFL